MGIEQLPKSFNDRFIELVGFADRIVAMLCYQPGQRTVVLETMEKVLTAKALSRSGDHEKSELILKAIHFYVSDPFQGAVNERWSVINSICEKFHEFAESAIEIEDDFMFVAQTLHSRKESLSRILAEHIRTLYPEPTKCAVALIEATTVKRILGIGSGIFGYCFLLVLLGLPVCYSLFLLDMPEHYHDCGFWGGFWVICSYVPLVGYGVVVIESILRWGFIEGMGVLLAFILLFCVSTSLGAYLDDKAGKISSQKLHEELCKATKAMHIVTKTRQTSSVYNNLVCDKNHQGR